jgi:iron complex transport system substrate-binding protein
MSRSRRSHAANHSILTAVPAAILAALLVAACTGGGSLAPASPAPATPGPTPPIATPAPTPAITPTPGTPAADTFPVTVTGFDGVETEIPARPERIVSLTPAVTETLAAIGAADRLVARSEDPNPFPATVAGVPAVTSMMAVDVEQIVALEPDLVLAGGLGFTPDEAIARLRNLGIPVVALYAPNVASVLEDIRTLGRAVGESAAADALADTMRADIDAVAAAAAAAGPPPRVFYEIDATGDIYGPADQSFIAELLTLAGADPITTGSPDVYSIPLERLIEADPQVILLGDAAYPGGPTPEIVAARNGWGAMTAVKERAILPVDDIVITRPGPRLPEGLRALVLAIHPGVELPEAPGS